MCIIVCKHAGISMPSHDRLATCFRTNPDGGGIMLAHKGTVYGFKGLMTLDDFTEKLTELSGKFGDLQDLPIIIHFRIGTHGSNCPANTQPFPVTNDYKVMGKTVWKSDLGIAHNGVMENYCFDQDIHTHNVSDTQIFIKRCVYPLWQRIHFTENEDLLDLLYYAAGSKLAFLDGDGKINIRGKFLKGDDGCYYSNASYDLQTIAEKSPPEDWLDDIGYSSAWLSGSERLDLMAEKAYDLDLASCLLGHFPGNGYIITTDGEQICLDEFHAVHDIAREIYEWHDDGCHWQPTGKFLAGHLPEFQYDDE